jgi:hypothetical protein
MKPGQLKEPAYRLTRDVERFSYYEPDYYADLWVENVPVEIHHKIFGEKPVDAPRPVLYSGYPPIVEPLDFPVTDNNWTIMSRRMIDALKSAGEFEHVEFPVVVADSRVPRREWFDAKGRLRRQFTNRNFAAIQLTGHLDIFDFERSKYRHNANFPAYIGTVEEFVFKLPEKGLPPLFHVKGEPVKLFVSHKARLALKDAGITGVEYISLKGVRGESGRAVDVPTPIPRST